MSHPVPERNEFVDTLRGILIFLVVWGHSIQYLAYSDESFWSDGVFKLIYSFHMPLFMALSGYVSFNSIQRHRPGRHRRAPPAPADNSDFLLVAPAPVRAPRRVRAGRGAWAPGFAHDLAVETGLWLWFLWAAFFATVLTAGLHRLRADRWPVFGLVAAALLFLPEEYNLSLIKNVVPYFFLGYLVAEMAAAAGAPHAVVQLAGRGTGGSPRGVWRGLPRPPCLSVRDGIDLPHLARSSPSGPWRPSWFRSLSCFWWASCTARGASALGDALGRRSLGIYVLQAYVFYGLRWLSLPAPPVWQVFSSKPCVCAGGHGHLPRSGTG